MANTKPIVYTLADVRALLDTLAERGLTSHDIAAQLELHQVRANARSVRHWYSGKTNVRNVEFRALRDLLNEVKNNG